MKILELTLWQKKQAALLYLFASDGFLKELEYMVDALQKDSDTMLSTAESEHRDQVLFDQQWGTRNTAENWANNAWSLLLDFKRSIQGDLAARANDLYAVTGATQFVRASSEYSMQWATPDEEKRYDELIYRISHHATLIDETMHKREDVSRWADFDFAMTWDDFRDRFPRLPKVTLVTNVEGESGSVPPRTGVYVPQDDPNGSLQFAWTGRAPDHVDGILANSSTFNETGLNALKVVGRRELWFNVDKMYAFATRPEYASTIRPDLYSMNELVRELAPSAVARHAFVARPCKWYFVQLVEGEFEDYDDNTIPGPIDERLRVEAGSPCPKAGYYFTPVRMNSRRYFSEGDIMPDTASSIGITIWQSTD